MKRFIAVLAGTLMMSATIAMAAPPTPVFNPAAKIGEGSMGSMFNELALDGSTLYASFGSDNLFGGESGKAEAVRISKSVNTGATWGLSKVLQASDYAHNFYVRPGSARVAVSNDPSIRQQDRSCGLGHLLLRLR